MNTDCLSCGKRRMGINGECEKCAKARLNRVFEDIRKRRKGDEQQLSGQTGFGDFV